MRPAACVVDVGCKVCERPESAPLCAPWLCKMCGKQVKAAHHQWTTCSIKEVGQSLCESCNEYQPPAMLTMTWCLRTQDDALHMLMRHQMMAMDVWQQRGHFACACRMHMWHTGGEEREIRRTIRMPSAKRPTWHGCCGSPRGRTLELPVYGRRAVSTAVGLPQCGQRSRPS